MSVQALRTRGPVLTGIATLILLIGGLGSWSLLAEIDGAVVAHGQVEVDQNKQVVQHPEGGVVTEIAVKEAQVVKAGDLLIRLDAAPLHSQLAIVEGQLFDALAQKNRLEAERDDLSAPLFANDLITLAATHPEVAEQIDGQRRLFFARKESLSRQVAQLEKRKDQIQSQIEGNNAQYRAAATQETLVQAELRKQKILQSKGLTQTERLLALERDITVLQGSIGFLAASRAEAEGRATEVALEVLRLESQRREDAAGQLRDLAPQMLELGENQRALAERISRLDIRAPVSGIVLGLQVTAPRSVLRAADPVLYIVPQDRALVVDVMVPPARRGAVHLGQTVRLSFPALASRLSPDVHGRITAISADTFTDQRNQMPFFRVQIALDQTEIAALVPRQLLPGMPADAFIETGSRSAMSYLLKPFTDYFSTAFREN